MASALDHQGPRRVLVVDDSPLALEVIRRALEPHGFRVDTASTSGNALARCQRVRPDVVISDLHMPDEDGFGFLQRLHDFDSTIPVVMTSGEDQLPLVLQAVHAGVYDYVPKSQDPAALIAAVTRAAQHSQVMRENVSLTQALQSANQKLEIRVAERTAQLAAMNAELQQVMTKLLASERLAAIGQLAASIAHEINNPLAYLLSNVGYAKARFEELGETASAAGHDVAALNEALREAEDGAVRIGEIVRDVRTMSRVDERTQPFDLNNAVRSASRIAGERYKSCAELVMTLAPNVMIMGSPGRLTQVMINLLVNAADGIRDAQDNKPHRIVVLSYIEGDRAVVSVEDDGVGIPQENLSRIFDAFFTTKAESVGTGLGLAISRDIVEQLGGTIAVQSQVGVGTTFTISFPAHTSQDL